MKVAAASRGVALLYPGERAARWRSGPAEPAICNHDFADEVQQQLMQVDTVRVWCKSIECGRRRDRLDRLLRGVVDAGVVVSAHPDTILRLGTQDVLLPTRELPAGSDTHRIDSLQQLQSELPVRPRVLKPWRGHSGIGARRVELDAQHPQRLRVQHARRGAIKKTSAGAACCNGWRPASWPGRAAT